ncbi:MAG: hypothetical protein ACLR17_00455 [Enterobacteriaceae bacterium]
MDITAVLIGDGGGVILPTDPDDLAAVTALFGQFGRETFDSDLAMRGLSVVRFLAQLQDYRVRLLERRGWSALRGRSSLTAHTRRHTSRHNQIPSSKRSF